MPSSPPTKMYIIRQASPPYKRFNSKSFKSYDEARNYVRRWLTKALGKYVNNIGEHNFKIEAK